MESRSKRANDPTSYQGENIQRFLVSFSNRSIVVARGSKLDLCAFGIDTIFKEMGWSTLFCLKKPTYPKLIKMFFANMRVNMKHKIVSSLQDKHIEFDCDTLDNILGI